MGSIILPPGTAPASPSEGELYYDNTAKQVKFRDNSGFKALGTADLQGEPHIITKKLFPAYLGKLLDDTTSHSGNYGTEQADGRMYYYTEIAGSKPIHDPRIGVHFGSQRHKFKSLQLLEQETATHGVDVASVDGREWIRTSGKIGGSSDPVYYRHDSHGTSIMLYRNGTGFFEITGYFNDVNFLNYTAANRGIQYYLDGGSANGVHLGTTTAGTPLNSRYVDAGSLVNLGLSTNLGIHTIKIKSSTSDDTIIYGIELIAQDTTSNTTKVQIQVPAQDVVSYGRKFSVSATAQHYDPFDGFSSGNATALEAKVDTATSLGLAKWLHSGSYYRPYNGMRVVKWIDENGAIKTSVTCMPPNAKSIADSSTVDGSNSAANAKANASVANNTFYPTFEAHTTSVYEDNLHEVAKTYHWREFGNGAANGGTGATWADASMLSADDDISYCMDDGTTSFAGNDIDKHASHESWDLLSSSENAYYTFIGTGFSFNQVNPNTCTYTYDIWVDGVRVLNNSNLNGVGLKKLCQNLPYGSHIIRFNNTGTSGSEVATFDEVSFHQPKRPPIPDSACVLADYMVFADFKPQTTNGTHLISKGVRRQNISRDVFFDETDGDSFTFAASGGVAEGFQAYLSGNADSPTSMKLRIPSFGTNYVHRGFQSETRVDLFIGDTNNGGSATDDDNATTGSYAHLTSDLTLGVHQFGVNATSGTNGNTSGFDIVTPVHTSHHYQTFETPRLHELVGGDRSMEQTNLICSSDGKSWDEITRDTSYIGNHLLNTVGDNSSTGNTTINIFDNWRGQTNSAGTDTIKPNWIKDSFAIAYDRIICLKEGSYQIMVKTYENAGHASMIYINDVLVSEHYTESSSATNILNTYLKRGDMIQIKGQMYVGLAYTQYAIIKI